MKNLIAIIFGALICSTSFAQSQMVPFPNQTNPDFIFTYNPKTGVSDYDAQGYLNISFTVQIADIKKSTVMTNKTYVRISDCQTKAGHISIDWLDGSPRMVKAWVSGGLSFTDGVADKFCSIAKENHIY